VGGRRGWVGWGGEKIVKWRGGEEREGGPDARDERSGGVGGGDDR